MKIIRKAKDYSRGYQNGYGGSFNQSKRMNLIYISTSLDQYGPFSPVWLSKYSHFFILSTSGLIFLYGVLNIIERLWIGKLFLWLSMSFPNLPLNILETDLLGLWFIMNGSSFLPLTLRYWKDALLILLLQCFNHRLPDCWLHIS